jgi:hypothetical protein
LRLFGERAVRAEDEMERKPRIGATEREETVEQDALGTADHAYGAQEDDADGAASRSRR